MYRHSEHRQQRWRSPDESHFTRGIHGGYLLSSSQGIFACVSSTTPSGRTEGCLVSPLGKPLFSRHAKVPRDEQFHFSPEESHRELWTLLGSLCWALAATAASQAREKGCAGSSAAGKAGQAAWDWCYWERSAQMNPTLICTQHVLPNQPQSFAEPEDP